MTNDQLKAIWHDYLDSLKVAADGLFRSATPDDEATQAEGLRHLSRLVRLGLMSAVEYGDPRFPVLARYVDDVTKFGCDNPDTIYQRALLDPACSYVIRGTRGTVDYLSFITSKPGAEGRSIQVDHIDTDKLAVDADGRFEIHVSRARAGGNWLRMDEETRAVSVRQTFIDRTAERAATLEIHPAGDPVRPPPPTIEQMRAALAAASGFTRYCATLFPDWTHAYLAHPNQLPPADQDACLRAGGDPNIYFYRSFWRLAPDEALVVHIPEVPPCDSWNVQVDNFWQESMDYRHYRSSINKGLAACNSDGSVTIVIAHDDPGHPNWLETAGHRCGHFAMRWIRAERHVDPVVRLCKIRELAATLSEFSPAATLPKE